MLNYKIDSTTFWNHFFIAALRTTGRRRDFGPRSRSGGGRGHLQNAGARPNNRRRARRPGRGGGGWRAAPTANGERGATLFPHPKASPAPFYFLLSSPSGAALGRCRGSLAIDMPKVPTAKPQ